jgi:hypothetical protein
MKEARNFHENPPPGHPRDSQFGGESVACLRAGPLRTGRTSPHQTEQDPEQEETPELDAAMVKTR